ncbi:DNA-binding protein [Devosia sp. BK]|uniref:DNA-binding protein n=1 Tax=Devosia sp. BK TaxID=2871706 RepID=UPI00293B210E|nr:DNA-binding protein [Devosia sp. BK]MDV3253689.1 DNA-binding protein [Devosia sp. BK]
MLDTDDISEDLLFGADAIAEFLGTDRRQVYHFHQMQYLPIFRIGSTLCCRRSTIANWILERERANQSYNRGLSR